MARNISLLKNFSPSLRKELLTGFQVSLIAMPLCLGIAIVSGFPPMAGIVSAVVGGILLSLFGGSHLTITGPAAGLIVVILHGVERLGHGDPVSGYRLTLAAIVVAGILQIVFGLCRLGRLSAFFPGTAVHGMMAAIGLIILSKQIPVLLGTKASASSVFGIFAEVPQMLLRMNPYVATIGFLGILIMVLLPKLKNTFIRKIPAPLLVVLVGAVLAKVLGLSPTSLGSNANAARSLFVNIPENIFSSLSFPDFSQLRTLDFFITVISISLVASLETLLSVSAVEKLDPKRRKSDLDRELVALGTATTISGLFGGLPMIAEIVRSRASIDHGAETKWANFFHSIFLLMAVLLIPMLLRSIPLSALAALLMVTGYRLTSPNQLRHISELGRDQLLIFLTTLIFVLTTDLLIGIAAACSMKILLHVLRKVPFKDFFRCKYALTNPTPGTTLLKIKSSLVFTNLPSFIAVADSVALDQIIIIDLTEAQLIDHTSIDRMHEFKKERNEKGGQVEIRDSTTHKSIRAHALATRRLRT